MSVTVLGLGPGSIRHLTQEASQVLHDASELYVRTRRHPIISELPASLTIYDFDNIYEHEKDFAAVYETIAQQVIVLGSRRERAAGLRYPETSPPPRRAPKGERTGQ